jgi:chemotaxis protein CheC
MRKRKGGDKVGPKELSQEELSILTRLISKATLNAISGIAEMIGRDVEVRAVNLRQLTAENVPAFLKDPESILIGIDLEIRGDAEGNMLLIYSPQIAFGLVDLLVGNPLGQTQGLEEMGASALGEMGNIAGGFFLNSLADDTGMRLLPSTPTVTVDTVSALLDGALKPLAEEAATVFVLQTIFRTQDQQISGNFLVMPTASFLDSLVKHAARAGHVLPQDIVQYHRG